MKALLRRVAAIASCLLFTAAGSHAADAVELKPQWIVGKRYTQQMKMNQQSTFAIGEQKMEQTMDMIMEATMTVSQHEDPSLKRLKVKYDRVSMNMSMNGQKMGFDSSKSDNGEDPAGLGKAMGGMIGKEFSVVMDPDGKVKDVEKLDDLLAGLDGPAGAQVKQMFTKEQFAQMMEQTSLHNFPKGPVAPGATWPLSFEMPMPAVGKIAIKGTYTYKAMSDRGGVPCAEILTDAKLTFDFKPAGADDEANKAIAQIGMRFEGGKMTGSTWFDPKLGTPRGMEMNQEMTMKMNNPLEPTQTIEVPIKQKVSMDLVKVEDVK